MHLPEHLLPEMSTMELATFIGSLLAMIDAVCKRLLIFLRECYATIGMPALREFSRMFQDALQHPGAQLLNQHLVLIALVVSSIIGVLSAIVLWRLLWTGIRADKKAFKTIDQDGSQSTTSMRDVIIGYFQCLGNRLLEGLVLFGGILVMSTVLFVFCKTLWFTYLASPIGRFYPVYFPHRASLISMVLERDIFVFPIVLTVISFSVGMICSTVCRLFHLTRHIYLSRGLMGRIILLALPVNIVAAAALRPIFFQPHWGAAYAATLIPTLLSFNFCFRFTNRFLPELGMLFRGFARKGNAPMHITLLRNLHSGKTVLGFDPLSGRCTGKRFPLYDGVQTQGLYLSRRGHEFILYRYGRDLFFQVDDLELTLQADMSVTLLEKGRFWRHFELSRDGAPVFRLNWLTFPMSGARGATVEFFGAFEEILNNREAYESTFIIEDEPEPAEHDLPA